ncbi:KPN_02809 family neutral zinc metallopeptidase [Falsiroseomonas tokyonensis]|uniref:Neutral zinc metallopeptidase n=1 Tax=Falsiroseomonas tokyonensis TaxID=430521 RepID=A0ABV7BPX8_9PROT|nr:neutral zinc metallopeptidase [Falsiroseomonas tokyonensis]MBU8537609.1 zinc metallopeptidase [Falsiroseomonas tokyonensis]
MRLGGGRESGNVEDRRGGGGIGRGGIAIGGGFGGVVLVVLALLFGVDPSVILSGMDPAPQTQQRQADGAPAQDEGARFVRRVLAETEDVWTPAFREIGREYRAPKLVLFSGAVQSACGVAQAQVGPFYCPGDQQVYIDLDFLAEMQRRLGAPGDFAAAYVIAHEVGHHVQNQLGVLGRAQRGDNAMQVRIELQADCLAGLWARRAQDARQILEDGDIEEGLGAAAAVGDDRLQRRGGGQVVPESFTHGSSAQRVRWFRAGLQSGQLTACDTFGARQL